MKGVSSCSSAPLPGASTGHARGTQLKRIAHRPRARSSWAKATQPRPPLSGPEAWAGTGDSGSTEGHAGLRGLAAFGALAGRRRLSILR